MQIDTAIRLGTIDDNPFILSSWSKAMYDIYPNKYQLDFTKHYKEYLNSIIPFSFIIVQHDLFDINEIISYLVYSSFHDRLVIHYAYTKLDARKQGKIRELIQFANPIGLPVVFTHPAKNENAMEYFTSKYIYDPTLLKLLYKEVK